MPKEGQVRGVASLLCAPAPGVWRCRGGCANRLLHLGLGSAPGSGAGDRGLAITNFRATQLMKSVAARAPQPSRRGDCSSELGRLSQSPRPSAPLLWRYAIGERVGVKIGVITQTVPGTVFLRCLSDAVFFARGKVIPRIVPG